MVLPVMITELPFSDAKSKLFTAISVIVDDLRVL
jgi:hypothetical protein